MRGLTVYYFFINNFLGKDISLITALFFFSDQWIIIIISLYIIFTECRSREKVGHFMRDSHLGILKGLSLKYFDHTPYDCTVLIYM